MLARLTLCTLKVLLAGATTLIWLLLLLLIKVLPGLCCCWSLSRSEGREAFAGGTLVVDGLSAEGVPARSADRAGTVKLNLWPSVLVLVRVVVVGTKLPVGLTALTIVAVD